MSVTPDKKDGVLTGRFRVELQTGTLRYRKRHDTYKVAKADDDRVRAIWAAGGALQDNEAADSAPKAHTITTAIAEAKGTLWAGQAQEDVCWARVERMGAILGKTFTLDAIDTLAVDRIIKRLKADGASNSTINGYLSHLRKLLAWCKKRKMTTADLGEIEFSRTKVVAGRIRWITPEEEAVLVSITPPNVAKLIKVAIETGCRRDELLTVEPTQINGDRLHLWKTKTNSPRTVYMEPETTALLVDLVNNKTMPTRNYLRRKWSKARTDMGLSTDGDFVFHCCRHTRATRLVEAGIDIRVVKEMLGHSRIETTVRYAHVKASNIESAMEKVGEYARSKAEKANVSNDSLPPPPSPTEGVIIDNTQWLQFQEWLKTKENGAPEMIRTSDPQIRNLVLYPAELRARRQGH
jgi:integrase